MTSGSPCGGCTSSPWRSSSPASHFDRWSDGLLQMKLSLVIVVAGLVLWHTRRPRMHALEAVVFVLSLVIVWLGLAIAH
jgi:hypothetical protein